VLLFGKGLGVCNYCPVFNEGENFVNGLKVVLDATSWTSNYAGGTLSVFRLEKLLQIFFTVAVATWQVSGDNSLGVPFT